MAEKIKKLIFSLLSSVVLICLLSSCAKTPYSYNLDDYLKLPTDWTGISVTESEIQSSKEAIIQSALNNISLKTEVTNGVTQLGDIVSISYELMVEDGGAQHGYSRYDDLCDDSCVLQLGKYKYPVALEDSLIGLAVNESFEVVIEPTMNFSYEPLVGKRLKYVGRVTSIVRESVPELSEDVVKRISGCNTVDEYEAKIYEEAKRNLYFEKLLNKTEVLKYPEKELKKFTSDYANYYALLANESGITLEQYVNRKFYLEMQDFYTEADIYAKDLVKREMLIYQIADKYDVSVSDSEYSTKAYEYALEYGLDSVKKLEGKFGKDIVKQTILMDKVIDFIISKIENPVT